MKKILFPLVLTFLISCYAENEEELFAVPARPSFAAHIQPIITQSCAIPSCHTTDGNQILFNTYEEVKAKVDNQELPSSFKQRVLVLRDMPPSTQPALSDIQIQTIERWIEQGALNN